MTCAPRLERLFRTMSDRRDNQAIAEGLLSYSYGDLLSETEVAGRVLDLHGIKGGDVVGLQTDFGFSAIAVAFALFRRGCIVAFLSLSANADERLADCHARGMFSFAEDAQPHFRPLGGGSSHPLVDRLRMQHKPGFVIFSSGSSGRPKAILHDLDGFFAVYERPMKPMTTFAFLLFDHIAGLDTLFYTLHAGGTLVLEQERSPRAVCAAISRWQVEILPASPSFLKLLCMSDASESRDLSSLRIVTFGSEPMDGPTLTRVAALLPHAELRQKYGASEFGAPSVKTRQVDGLWIRFYGDAARVKGGTLWVQVPTTMLGYLNADQPPVQDGWICTGDRVEVDGEWIKILGRDSDLINVGGEKVFPSEVEAVINELEDVAEVAVSGESHPFMGQVVSATVRPRGNIQDFPALRSLVRSHCLKRLARYKVPAKISFTNSALFNERQKLRRSSEVATCFQGSR